jgi:hypothetical protein
MNFTKKVLIFSFLLFLVCGSFLFFSKIVKAEGKNLIFSEEYVFSGNGFHLDIYEDILVYEGDWNYLNLFNINTKENVETSIKGYRPQIYGDNVAYNGWNETTEKTTINLYNIKTKKNIEIDNYYNSDYGSWIYGQYVVWADESSNNRKVYLYNINTKEKQAIHNTTGAHNVRPVVYGDKVVWYDAYTFIYDILDKTITKLEDGDTHFNNFVSHLEIYDDRVVGDGASNNDNDINIFVRDLKNGEEFRITHNEYMMHRGHDIYEDKIVWIDYRDSLDTMSNIIDNRGDVFLYDLSTNKEYKITQYDKTDTAYSFPVVYKNIIAWGDGQSGKIHIVTFIENDDNQDENNINENINSSLSKRLSGKLLLDVDQGGAIWYVDDINYQRHNVRWNNALSIFQKFALGITDVDLLKIPTEWESIRSELDTDGDGYKDKKELMHGYNPYNTHPVKLKYDLALADRLKGKFLLQVYKQGAIWYVDHNGYRHSVRWDNLEDLFRRLALGITNSDLNQIGAGE